MSVFDYSGAIEFTSYERSFLVFLLKECPSSEFGFLEDISIDEVVFKWYDDSNAFVQGGFYYPSRNVIYINRGAFPSVSGDSDYSQIDFRLVSALPVILHELYHYWQSRHYGILYLFMQLPFIRNRLLEKEAYSVEDAAYSLAILSCGMSTIAKKKVSFGFGNEFFDELEKRFIS